MNEKRAVCVMKNLYRGLAMRTLFRSIFALCILLFTSLSEAALFSCLDLDSGRKVMSSTPCENGSKEYAPSVTTVHRTKSSDITTPQTPAEIQETRCEDMFKKAVVNPSSGKSGELSAEMWVQMGCKGHCDELYFKATDNNGWGAGTRRRYAAAMFSVCKN